MSELERTPAGREAPEISFIMPCYDEEEVIPITIPDLCRAFAARGHRLQLVATDNGSHDRTGEIIRELAREYPVTPHRVEHNEGYGKGVLESFAVCQAPWIGIIPADGQVDAEDVVRLWEAVKHTNSPTLGKVRRRFRLDGFRRKVISVLYNGFVRLLWPRLASIDVNGSPKILHRDTIARMDLVSKDWFLDPEIMIKAHYMGVRVLEMNVFARMRGNGLSHIRASTCWEFFWSILRFKLGGYARWKRRHGTVGQPIPALHGTRRAGTE